MPPPKLAAVGLVRSVRDSGAGADTPNKVVCQVAVVLQLLHAHRGIYMCIPHMVACQQIICMYATGMASMARGQTIIQPTVSKGGVEQVVQLQAS